MYKRIFVIVLDSVGIGFMPDAELYDDLGTNTLFHTSKAANGLKMPLMTELGLGNLTSIVGVPPVKPKACVSRMLELSTGKDTLTGHWEMMGVFTKKPFITFTETGFPKELIDEIEKLSHRKVIGNIAASGTEIIKELGERQMKTGELIVYTSMDSVLQIAAHEDIIPLNELYDICSKVRELTNCDRWRVGRVIARPFKGSNAQTFARTSNRHDYAVKPTEKTVLSYLKEANYDVISVGKIEDIFAKEGITEGNKIKSNHDGMEKAVSIAKKSFNGLCFVNLVDFDSLYGHRRDALGYAKALEEFDSDLKDLLNVLNDDDLLILTADHGNDPTYKGTDHTREMVPLIVYNKLLSGGIMDDSQTFADIGASIAENFNIKMPNIGKSFLKIIK